MAATGEPASEVCRPRPTAYLAEPRPDWVAAYAGKLERFRRLYAATRTILGPPAEGGDR
jgi:hypothetical protein